MRASCGYRIVVITRDGNEGDAIKAPTIHTHEHGATLINVTMEGAAVVVRPVGRLDAETVATITQLLDSARAAGTVAVLHVDAVDPRDRLVAQDLLAASGQITPASVA
jgi:hypothetical protein